MKFSPFYESVKTSSVYLSKASIVSIMKTSRNRYLFIFVSFLTFYDATCEKITSCYQKSPHQPHYGTETIYSVGLRLIKKQLKFSRRDSLEKGCKPVNLQLFIRNGARYPSGSNIEEARLLIPLLKNITDNFYKGKSGLCSQDVNALEDWSLTYNKSKAMQLAARGEREIMDLAQTYKLLLPNIFRKPYSPEYYEFLHTPTERAEMSARNFAIELFGMNDLDRITFRETGDPDPFLRPYEDCSKWIKNVYDNDSTFKELKEFKKSDAVKLLVKSVSERLGFLNKNLSFDDLQIIHSVCRYEYGVKERYSPWCAAFSERDIQVLEYYLDLKDWWLHGYGSDTNKELACETVKRIIDTIRKISHRRMPEKFSEPKAFLRFTHSKFMLHLFTALGIFKDSSPMTSDGLRMSRKWRLSAIDPVASNVGFVLYQCPSRENVTFKVQVLVQGNVVKLSHCSRVTCDLDEFLDGYEKLIDDCDYSRICSGSTSSYLPLTNVHHLLIISSFLLVQNVFK